MNTQLKKAAIKAAIITARLVSGVHHVGGHQDTAKANAARREGLRAAVLRSNSNMGEQNTTLAFLQSGQQNNSGSFIPEIPNIIFAWEFEASIFTFPE